MLIGIFKWCSPPLPTPQIPNQPLFFVEPRKPHLEPCIFNDPLLLLHLRYHFFNQYCNVTPRWQAWCAFFDSFFNHPLDSHLLDAVLEVFIKPYINRLTGGSASTMNVLNSLTAKSVPAGTKLVLFGMYTLNIYVGIVRYILCKTKTWHAKIYLPTQPTNWQISYDIN